MSEYDGKEIEFYFRLYDKVNNVASRRNNFFVDDTLPVITINRPLPGVYLKSVVFDIDINETVDKLEYVDLSQSRQIFKKLCHDCSFYVKTKSFDEGNHILLFRATDYAGNIGINNVNFTIV